MPLQVSLMKLDACQDIWSVAWKYGSNGQHTHTCMQHMQGKGWAVCDCMHISGLLRHVFPNFKHISYLVVSLTSSFVCGLLLGWHTNIPFIELYSAVWRPLRAYVAEPCYELAEWVMLQSQYDFTHCHHTHSVHIYTHSTYRWHTRVWEEESAFPLLFVFLCLSLLIWWMRTSLTLCGRCTKTHAVLLSDKC